MKKTIQKPDGSTEVVEGTPEEIAEYERKLKGEIQKEEPKKGPGLLTEKFDLAKMLEEYRKNNPEPQPYIGDPYPWWRHPIYRTYPIMEHSPTCQLVEAGRGWWSVVPPRCTCGLIAYPDQSYRIITTPGTGQGIDWKWGYGTWSSSEIKDPSTSEIQPGLTKTVS